MQTFDLLSPHRAKRLAWYIKKLNPVAYYPLNEVDGTTAVNYAPANLRTLNGTITGATIGQDGLLGKAYSFDGVNDEVDFNVKLAEGEEGSILVLFKPTIDQRQLIFGRVLDTSNLTFIEMIDITGGISLEYYIGGVKKLPNLFTTTGLSLNNWVMICLSWSIDATSTYKLYTNGILRVTDTDTVRINDINANDRISNFNSDRYLAGLVQHVALFNRALTADEITKLAQIAGLV